MREQIWTIAVADYQKEYMKFLMEKGEINDAK
jgi:hypothetical protein